MEVEEDFKELLKLFNKHQVDFLIVGGYALAFHGAPRYTGDMDIFVKPSKENAEKILVALKDFGFGSLGLSVEDFAVENKVIQLGVPPVRIDILTSISGIDWNTAFTGREKGEYGGLTVYFIGRQEFIINKKILHRHKDLADIEAIGEKID